MPYIIKSWYMHKQINQYDYLSKIYYCTQWHINWTKLLLWLCVLFYPSFVYTCVCVFLHLQSPLRECRSIQSGASGLAYYCASLECISVVIGLLAVWWHNEPKTKKKKKIQRRDTNEPFPSALSAPIIFLPANTPLASPPKKKRVLT